MVVHMAGCFQAWIMIMGGLQGEAAMCGKYR